MADIQEEQSRPGDRCILVIFGASGDLTKRKLIPSLYNLGKKNLLPAEFALVGVASDALTDEEFRARLRQDLREFANTPEQCSFCDWLLERAYYTSGDFRDPATYDKLKTLLATLDDKHATRGNYFYYLATSP